MNLWEEIRETMREFGQLKLSEATGISLNSICGYVNGRHYPTVDKLFIILDAMDKELCLFDKEE